MIKTILEMTGRIVEFELESKDVPELSTAIDISTNVTQIIISVLACSIQFTTLVSMIDEYVEIIHPCYRPLEDRFINWADEPR